MTDTPVTTEGPEEIKLRRISEEELEKILKNHFLWRTSNGEEGNPADLSKVDLKGRDLEALCANYSDLEEIDLAAINFSGADLSDAHLQEFNLSDANLSEARLSRAHLVEAVLIQAEITEADLFGTDLTRANLTLADLSRSVLETADFHGANLAEADLSNSFLRAANFNAADLRGAKFLGADLRDAQFDTGTKLANNDFREANLPGQDLRASTDLLSSSLAGAILNNAKLPDEITFDGRKIVEETSKHARNIFLAMIAACVFCWLTIATTTDVALISNAATTPLPIINTKIPIAGFYWFAPIILLAAYVYLHLYLQRMWEGLAELPAVFPDGRRLDQTAYPWLLSGLVTAHMPRLKDRRPPLSRLQNFISIVLAWWLVPLTLVWFWGRSLPAQDWRITGTLAVLIALTISVGYFAYGLAKQTLSGDLGNVRNIELQLWRSFEKFWRPGLERYRRVVRVGGLSFMIFIVLTLGTINGSTYFDPFVLRHPFAPSPATWIPATFSIFGYDVFAELKEQEVSTKPASWTGIGNNEQIAAQFALVKGASLRARNLRHATAMRAFLVRADLQDADLRHATLSFADLRHAKLQFANLSRANLSGANLSGASLNNADLSRSILAQAKFGGAKFDNANLKGVDLRTANNLGNRQLRGACGDRHTRLPAHITVKLRPCPPTWPNWR